MNEEILPLPEECTAPEAAIFEVPHPAHRFCGLPGGIRFAIALALCVCTAIFRLSAPELSQELSRWVVGDGGERLQQAFASMDRAAQEGEGLGEAWEVFCRELDDETA